MSLAPLDSESISMTKCSNDCRCPVWNTGCLVAKDVEAHAGAKACHAQRRQYYSATECFSTSPYRGKIFRQNHS